MPPLSPHSPPGALNHAALVSAVRAAMPPSGETGRIGGRIEFHQAIGSTNDRARELAAQGEPEGTVVVAGEQTRGRGRAERGWHSAPGLGLYMSVILRPAIRPARAPALGLMAAVAACEALARAAPAPIHIKWPNDLLADREGQPPAKIAGILVEARTSQDGVRDLVIGMGVNLNHQELDFPEGLRRPATSLRMLTGRACDGAAVAAAILTALDSWYTLWKTQGDAPVLRAFRTLAPDLEGRRVRVDGGDGPAGASISWDGTTAGLTDDGALLVIPDGGGGAREVRYGDVTRVEQDGGEEED